MLNLILSKDIAPYVRRHKRLLLVALILSFISSGLAILPAYLLQIFIDEGMKTGSDPVTWKIPWLAFESGVFSSWHKTEMVLLDNVSPNKLLLIISAVLLVSVYIKSMSIFIAGLLAAAFGNRVVKSLRIDLFKKFISMPLGYYYNKRTGELIARSTADLTVMQSLIAHIAIGLMEYPFSIMVFLAYLFYMNYKLTLLIFLIAPFIVGLVHLFGKKVKKHAVRVQDAIAELTVNYQESLVGMRIIQGFFMGVEEVRKFTKNAEFLYKKTMRWSCWHLGLGPMLDATVFLFLPIVLIIGKIYFNHTLGELIAIIFAFSQLYSPFKKLSQVNNNLKTLQGATFRVFEIMNIRSDLQEVSVPKILSRHRKAIEFKDVSFAYSSAKKVLKNISFRINMGEMVAFVGSTGAGKSTLLDLIPRFHDVTKGKILIDGIDIREVSFESLRRQIGIVNQEVLLFNDTIINNIRYGAPWKTTEEIAFVARAAYAHDFILAQPQGYQTIIGDRGTLLSGGQRQRIAIARALLIDPSILLLDEAVSALDTESEKLVQTAIDELHGSRTIMIVAHRLSTIMKADRIFVLENGQIVESGTRKSLLAQNGRFRQLYDIQFRSQERGKNKIFS